MPKQDAATPLADGAITIMPIATKVIRKTTGRTTCGEC